MRQVRFFVACVLHRSLLIDVRTGCGAAGLAPLGWPEAQLGFSSDRL
jgi:hypothetical protein